jgi:hypothetical protein
MEDIAGDHAEGQLDQSDRHAQLDREHARKKNNGCENRR